MNAQELDSLRQQLLDADSHEQNERPSLVSRRWFVRTLAGSAAAGLAIGTARPARADCDIDNCGEDTCAVDACNQNTCSPNTCTQQNTCVQSNVCDPSHICTDGNTCQHLNTMNCAATAHNSCGRNQCDMEDNCTTNTCNFDACQINRCGFNQCTTADTCIQDDSCGTNRCMAADVDCGWGDVSCVPLLNTGY